MANFCIFVISVSFIGNTLLYHISFGFEYNLGVFAFDEFNIFTTILRLGSNTSFILYFFLLSNHAAHYSPKTYFIDEVYIFYHLHQFPLLIRPSHPPLALEITNLSSVSMMFLYAIFLIHI